MWISINDDSVFMTPSAVRDHREAGAKTKRQRALGGGHPEQDAHLSQGMQTEGTLDQFSSISDIDPGKACTFKLSQESNPQP